MSDGEGEAAREEVPTEAEAESQGSSRDARSAAKTIAPPAYPVLEAHGLRFLDLAPFPDIRIEEHLFTFVTGPSGCGKSTLLRLLSASEHPTAGTVIYRGRDIAELDAVSYRRRVLLAVQEAFLFEGTIADNFALYAEARGDAPASDEAMRAMLDVCCADFSPDSPCATLSGGERQRVFLAVCLSFNPDVLMLDEPTSALDGATARRLLANLRDHCAQRGITPVAVCHSDELTRMFADRWIDLSDTPADDARVRAALTGNAASAGSSAGEAARDGSDT